MKYLTTLRSPILLFLVVGLLFGACSGRKARRKAKAEAITTQSQERVAYHYYTLVGNRVSDRDPGNVITIIYGERKNRRKIKRSFRKQDLQIVEEGEIKEQIGPWYFLVEGKKRPLNRYREDRLTVLKANELISSAGFQLNPNFVTDKYASYSGVLSIRFTGSDTEARLNRTLEKLRVEVRSVERSPLWDTMFAECPSDYGTGKINELIEAIAGSDRSLTVAPEYDGIFSTVILEEDRNDGKMP